MKKRRRPRLVQGWRRSWRWFSVQSDVLTTVAAASWLAVPQDMRQAVPPAYLAMAAIALAVGGIVGRLIKQGDDDVESDSGSDSKPQKGR